MRMPRLFYEILTFCAFMDTLTVNVSFFLWSMQLENMGLHLDWRTSSLLPLRLSLTFFSSLC
jgi:hypothetical protein